MQGNYPSPSKPVYLPADYADVVAGDITLPRQGPAHPSVCERTIPAAAGRPPSPVPGLDDPTPMVVDPNPS